MVSNNQPRTSAPASLDGISVDGRKSADVRVVNNHIVIPARTINAGDKRDGPLLEVEDLRTHFLTPAGPVRAGWCC
mgnify:CR=1 FL=1